MKFLCDQCKAKYQIADDKVAGKTVRMKCRKCGHMIEVRSNVTETSVSIEMPASAFEPAMASQPPPAPTQKIASVRPPAARTGMSLATSLSSAGRPAPARPPTAAGSRPEVGLAGAFSRSVQREDDALEMLELHAGDQWYVAINGVPVGPVRVADLRRKASAGSVTEDSLVWQEGLEEWRPVKAISDLASVVREAIAAGRVSLATPPPGESRPSSPPAAQHPPRAGMPPRPAPGHVVRQGPGTAPLPGAPPPRTNVLPFAARGGSLATAERLDAGGSLAHGGAAPALHAAAPEPSSPLSVAPDPFAQAAPPVSPPASSPFSAPLAVPSSPLAAPRPSLASIATQKKPPPWIAIAMVVLAGAFGITAAIIVLSRPPQQAPQPVVINMPSAQPLVAGPLPVATGDVPPADSTSPAEAMSGGKPGVPRVAAGGPAKSAAATTTAVAPNPAITALLGSNNGPTPGGPTPGGPTGGGQLTSDQIEATVRTHQAGVKRSCLEKMPSDKAGTIQVTIAVAIGPTGSVKDASTVSGDPMVGKCIETSIRSWQFASSGGTTNVNIPFKFVRQ